MSHPPKACEGGQTNSTRMGCEHAQECRHCGNCVRDDLIDHRFFGFKAGCDEWKPKTTNPKP